MKNSTMKVFLSILVMFTFISTSACSSYKKINLTPDSVQQHIKPGDVVKVKTKDGRDLEFIAYTITSTSIIGNDDDKPIHFSDIDMIEKKGERRSGFYYFFKGLAVAASLPF